MSTYSENLVPNILVKCRRIPRIQENESDLAYYHRLVEFLRVDLHHGNLGRVALLVDSIVRLGERLGATR